MIELVHLNAHIVNFGEIISIIRRVFKRKRILLTLLRTVKRDRSAAHLHVLVVDANALLLKSLPQGRRDHVPRHIQALSLKRFGDHGCRLGVGDNSAHLKPAGEEYFSRLLALQGGGNGTGMPGGLTHGILGVVRLVSARQLTLGNVALNHHKIRSLECRRELVIESRERGVEVGIVRRRHGGIVALVQRKFGLQIREGDR